MTDRHTSVRASQLRNFTITAEDISANSITGDKFIDGTISGVKIAVEAISESKLDITNNPIDGHYLKYTVSSGMEWGTVSGITDHGELTGRDDDDHPQYILVDGTRGFTSTVSGVYPTENYHLTTKECVDNSINTAISGVGGLGNEYEDSSETESTTTSTNWQQKLRLVLSDLEAGKYRIDWYYEWAHNNGNFQFKSRVQIDDTDTYMEQKVGTISDGYGGAAGFAYVNLTSGDHNIDLDYCSSKNGKTVYIRRARIAARGVS